MRFGALFCLALFFSFNAESATHRIATGEYAPFSGEKIPEQGISTQVVKAVFKEADLDITLEFLPWIRIMNNLKTGAIAGSFPWKENDERKKDLYYSEAINKFRILLFIKSDSTLTEKSINGKTLCVPDGWDHSAYDKLIKEKNITLMKPMNIESCFQMLALKRVDMIFINEYVGLDTVNKVFGKNPPVKWIETSFFPKENNLYFVASKKYEGAQAMIAKFNQGLAKIKKNGIYNEIIKKHQLTRFKSTCDFCNQVGLL